MPYKDPNYINNYRKTPAGRKSKKCADWKYAGMIGDYDSVFERYEKATTCELCDVVFEGNGNKRKCMDHNHITGYFRNVLCHSCNTQKKVSSRIRFNKKDKSWIFAITKNGVKYRKQNKNKQELLWHKFIYLMVYA